MSEISIFELAAQHGEMLPERETLAIPVYGWNTSVSDLSGGSFALPTGWYSNLAGDSAASGNAHFAFQSFGNTYLP